MSSTLVPAIKKIVDYSKINVIDVGAARASFLVELDQLVNLEKVFAIGIDPNDHGVSDHYDKFFQACVDNVDSATEMDFYPNMIDDQAGSLCSPVDKNKNKFGEVVKVKVLNLNDIIKEEIPSDEVIHFLKIDAEGKDLDIIKSLKTTTLERIKYIAMECPMTKIRLKGESTKQESIEYMNSINFDLFFSYDTDNGSDISDVVFINRKKL